MMGVEGLRRSGRGADLATGVEFCFINSEGACVYSFFEEMSLEGDSEILVGDSVGLPAKIQLSRGGRKYSGRVGGE
jgi:hypothetical protein